MTEDLVRSAYQDGEIASHYDRTRFRSLRGRLGSDRDEHLMARAIEEACGGPPASILDVACGSGRITSALVDRFPTSSVMGLDGSMQMLERARVKPNLRARPFVQSDATALPFAARSFDVVTAVRFVGHLEADACRQFFAELARVARSTVVVDVSITSGLVDLRRRTERRLRGSYLGFESEWTWRTFAVDELQEVLGEAGLELTSMRRKMPVWSDARIIAARV